jgi:integrase
MEPVTRKRGKSGEGSLSRRSALGETPEVWTLRLDLGPDPKTGKRRQPAATFKGSDREAAVALAAFVKIQREKAQEIPNTDAEAGNKSPSLPISRIPRSVQIPVDSVPKQVGEHGPTLNELFKAWVVAPAGNGKRKSLSTQYQDRHRYETHLAKPLGERLASSITSDEIWTVYSELGEAVSRKTGKPLSDTTLHRIHEVLRAIFYFGVRKKLITSTPFVDVRLVQPDLPDPTAPSKKAVMALMAYLKQHDLELFCAVNIAAVTGGRRSEIMALKFRDVDFGNKELIMSKGLIAVPHREKYVETKTKTGAVINDGVGIGDGLAEDLHDLYLAKLEMGLSTTNIMNCYIFSADKTGKKPWHPDTMTTRLREAQHSYWGGRRKITFKDLRTFVASDLVQKPGGLQIARDVLHHRTASTTLRHYLASDRKKNREATRGLADELRGTEEPIRKRLE